MVSGRVVVINQSIGVAQACRSVSSLRSAEAWLLCTLRLGMSRYDPNCGGAFFYEQGFIAARLPENVSEDFGAALGMIRSAAGDPLDIRSPPENDLSADEEAFLATIHALQQGDEFTARRLTTGWVSPHRIAAMLRNLAALAEGMLGVGLRIPSRWQVMLCPALSLAARRLTENDGVLELDGQPEWAH